jgi:drug/metabolite transporter (DMT)-like permease
MAALVMSVAFGIALSKGWFNRVPDTLLCAAFIVSTSLWIYWLATSTWAQHPTAMPLAFVGLIIVLVVIIGHYSLNSMATYTATPLPEHIIIPSNNPVSVTHPVAPLPNPKPKAQSPSSIGRI